MFFLFVMAMIALGGLGAIALAEPRRPQVQVAWNDDLERQLLRERSGRLRR
ncbi:MAG: hypothetical protein JOZ24_08190 [Candidatus Eremiobacteraeota bacterium]|nr:hypothetical protein [Candidatus Eremiobacteraeota bacterium]